MTNDSGNGDRHNTGDRKHDDHKHEPGRAIAALFQSKEEARQAIAALHKDHYTHSWYGVTSIAESNRGDETVTVEDAKPGFFSAKSQSIVDALVAHGVLGDTARSLESSISPGHAVVTVDPGDKDSSEAMNILQRCGGQIAGRGWGGASGSTTTGAGMSTAGGMSTSGAPIGSRVGTSAGGTSTATSPGRAMADGDDLSTATYDEEVFYQTPR